MKEIQMVESDINNITKTDYNIGITDINSVRTDFLVKKQEVQRFEIAQKNAPKDGDGDPIYQPQSDTMENYMDYDFDKNGVVNNKFKRKTLTHQQWKLIRKVGLNKGYLKL